MESSMLKHTNSESTGINNHSHAPWKKKPRQISPVSLEVEMIPSDSEESLSNFCSNFGKVQGICSFFHSEKKFAIICFDTPTALSKALLNPLCEELTSPIPEKMERLYVRSWKTFVPKKEMLIYELISSNFKRRIIYKMFMNSTDPMTMCKVIVNDITKFAEKSCVRIPSNPVVDFVEILTTAQKAKTVVGDHSVINAECIANIVQCDRVIPLSFPVPPSQFEPGKRIWNQPIIITNKVECLSNAEAEIFGSSQNKSQMSSDDNFRMRKLRYKMLTLGNPWDTYARRVVSDEDPKTNENIQPEVLVEKEIRSLSKKRKISGSSSDSNETSSSKISATSGTQSSEMSQLGKITFCDFTNHNYTRISSNKLHVDVLIICANLDLCRYLSAMFAIVHIDEILLNFHNRKLQKSNRYTFKDPGIKATIYEWWEDITSEKQHHKSYPMVQMRYAEYLAIGCHNIAITCCKRVISNTVANFYTYLGKADEIDGLNMYLYTFAAEIDPKNLFISGIKGFSLIIDHALGHTAHIPFLFRFRKEYYKMSITAICMIPFYILRSLAEENIRNTHYSPKRLF